MGRREREGGGGEIKSDKGRRGREEWERAEREMRVWRGGEGTEGRDREGREEGKERGRGREGRMSRGGWTVRHPPIHPLGSGQQFLIANNNLNTAVPCTVPNKTQW